jgi:hypothetical protein
VDLQVKGNCEKHKNSGMIISLLYRLHMTLITSI